MLKKELKINFKSLLIWTLIICIMLIVVFLIYPYMNENSGLNKIDEMMKMFPKEILEAFNMDSFSIATVFGWIKTEGYVFIILIGSIYSAILGSNILSNEEKDKTIEFLISKPITRNKIITSKLTCAFIDIFIFNLLVFLVELVGLSLSNELDFALLLKMSVSPLLLYYIMFSVSILITTMINNPKKTIYIGLSVAFIPYILQLLGTISDKIEILKNISFYEFISLKYLVNNGHINYTYLIIGFSIIIVCITSTYIIYNKKELV